MIIDVKISPDKRLKRDKGWLGIVIHHTGIGGNKNRDELSWSKWSDAMVHWLTKADDSYLSAHYVIARNGKMTMLVDPETHEAFHAGKSEFYHPEKQRIVTDCNRYFIGIELVGDGNLISYSTEQYNSLVELCRFLKEKYNIHPMCITGHDRVAPDRKSDPGKLFDWDKFFTGLYERKTST